MVDRAPSSFSSRSFALSWRSASELPQMQLSDLATLRAASIVLASGSPRRVEMFNALLKLNARVVP